MKKLISCEFNMDSACVELVYSDNSMISIDCTAVENEVADNLYQRSELNYLIYNHPPDLRGPGLHHAGGADGQISDDP